MTPRLCTSNSIEDCPVHPDTGVPIDGYLPHWEQVKQQVLDVTRSIKQLEFFGVDLAVTNDGIKFPEINRFPGLSGSGKIHQADQRVSALQAGTGKKHHYGYDVDPEQDAGTVCRRRDAEVETKVGCIKRNRRWTIISVSQAACSSWRQADIERRRTAARCWGWAWAVIRTGDSDLSCVCECVHNVGLQQGRRRGRVSVLPVADRGHDPVVSTCRDMIDRRRRFHPAVYRYLVTKIKFPISTIPTFVSMACLAAHLGLLAHHDR